MKLRTMIAAVGALALLASCGSSTDAGQTDTDTGSGTETSQADGDVAAPDEPFDVAIANFSEAIPIYHTIHTNLDEIAEKDPNLNVSWYNNDSDPATMLQNVKLMIDSEPDAIVILPVSNATEGISQLLEESGIPCVSVNLDTPACSFLNISNKDLGVQTAEAVAKEAAARGWDASNTTVLIGQAAASGEAVNDCVRYFYSVVADNLGLAPAAPEDITPTTTRIGDNGIQFDGQESMDESYSAVSTIAGTIPEGNNVILYTTNNDATNGALRALEERGLASDDTLLIGGLGGDTFGLTALADDPRWIAEGDIFIDYWGQYAVAMAQALAAGVTPPADVTPLPQQVFAKDEIDLVKTYHPDLTSTVDLLPPLVDDNAFLADTDLMRHAANIATE